MGAVPGRNSSTTALRFDDASPVHGSTDARSRLLGALKALIFQPLVASSMKPCHTYVVTSIENSGPPRPLTSELSELPFHAPTTSAYSSSLRPRSSGAAMKP